MSYHTMCYIMLVELELLSYGHSLDYCVSTSECMFVIVWWCLERCNTVVCMLYMCRRTSVNLTRLGGIVTWLYVIQC